jgi:1-phosphofructokinase/tagatose 6-phosphate kinase
VILTVTLNAALDRTVAVPRVRLGHRHRAVESRRAPGGKGVNVARTLKHLGEPVIATGLAGGATGVRIRELLTAEEVLHDFTEVAADSRTNISIVDPTSGEQTEINERGPEVSASEVDRFVERLTYLARGANYCVIAGSLPPGAPADIYAALITRLHECEVPVLLDTDGEPMRAGLRAQPAVVAPNIAEAEEAVGYEFGDPEDLNTGLRSLIDMGANEAFVTTANGCVAIAGSGPHRRRYEATIEPLEPVAAVGSGDAFLAGLASGRRAGRSPADSLAFAVACGAESTQHLGAGSVDASEVGRIADRVEVSELDLPVGVA